MADFEQLPNKDLLSELTRQQALAADLQTLATEHGLAWLCDERGEAVQAAS